MDPVALDRLPQEELSAFIGSSRQKPCRFLGGDPLAAVADAAFQDEITNLSRKNPDGAFGIREAGRLAGLAVCDDLPWDSRVLNGRWGVLKHLMIDPESKAMPNIQARLLNQALAWAFSHKIQALVCKVYTDDIPSIHALERRGFLYMDTNLDYVFDLRKDPVAKIPKPATEAGVRLRLAEKSDTEELMEVAGAAFGGHFSRYKVDERIPRDLSRGVYAEWIKSCMDGYADWVFIAEIGGRIAGYSAWKEASPADKARDFLLGHYSIAGIHPDFAGRGLFNALTYAGMQILDDQADLIEGPTHINNYSVQRGYHRLGWRIMDAHHSFHKWLEGD